MPSTSYTEFRNNLKAYMDMVNDDVDHLVITRQGRSSNAVLLSEAEWDSLQETLYVLNNADIMSGILESEADRKHGRVEAFSTLDGFREAMAG